MAIEDSEVVSRVNRILNAVFPAPPDRVANYDVTYAMAVNMGRYQWNEVAVWFEGAPTWDPAPTPPSVTGRRRFLSNDDLEADSIRTEALLRFDAGPELVPGYMGSPAEFVSRINLLLAVWFPGNDRKRADNFDVTSLFTVDLSRYERQKVSAFVEGDDKVRYVKEKSGEGHAIRAKAVEDFGPGDELRG